VWSKGLDVLLGPRGGSMVSTERIFNSLEGGPVLDLAVHQMVLR